MRKRRRGASVTGYWESAAIYLWMVAAAQELVPASFPWRKSEEMELVKNRTDRCRVLGDRLAKPMFVLALFDLPPWRVNMARQPKGRY